MINRTSLVTSSKFLNELARIVSHNIMPKVYRVLKDSQFSVQMSKANPFGCNEADKAMEHHQNRLQDYRWLRRFQGELLPQQR